MSADLSAREERRCLVMAGGTGGHVFPALAVADDLRARGWRVAWLGGRSGIENRLVPAAGYPLFRISIAGLRGKGWVAMLLAPGRLAVALVQATGVVLRVRPRVVLGMGGFASGPGGLVAWIARLPLLIHEQNAIPGMTNKILSRLAKRVLCAFPDSFSECSRVQWVGNPVRESIEAIPAPESRLANRQGLLRLLVLGGSQGAQVLNRMTGLALRALPGEITLVVRHQCGGDGEHDARRAYAGTSAEVSIEPFIEDMAGAYSWADLVLCRAGAMTVSELSAAGCASILIPYPHAVDDHQTANAEYLGNTGAARLIAESDFTPEVLARQLAELSGERTELAEMAKRARAMARPGAVAAVASACEEVALDR